MRAPSQTYLLGPRDEACVFLIQRAEEGQNRAAYAVQDKACKQHAPIIWVLFGVELCNERYCYTAQSIHTCKSACYRLSAVVILVTIGPSTSINVHLTGL